MDKRSCENLLQSILEEKQKEDEKKQIIQQERLINRNKVAYKHNLALEE